MAHQHYVETDGHQCVADHYREGKRDRGTQCECDDGKGDQQASDGPLFDAGDGPVDVPDHCQRGG
ncbi:hypothetical protein [Candidatus Reidiella endopervernicosa]|uniref:Uncharacterized protein n=1 Tax=Candidatus Reidiella endopervernicosa TaxID=2738883 RepID=A0A6N0HTE1_9GAMM|nr:hypothetical protein [Candidatus Reidiella endopervernicosa]QKQ25652.1 hypothetical protein HUE57_04600 [Candidatus Reidiella endopervernicosa]